MQTNVQKYHQSHGCYDTLIALAKAHRDQGQADTVDQALPAVLAREGALVARLLAGPKDPQWSYWPVIKRLTGYVDPLDAVTAHRNVIRKALPAYWDAERRGELMQPASAFVAKAAGDSVTVTGPGVLAQVKAMAEAQIERQRLPATPEAIEDMVMVLFRENPSLYDAYVREQLKSR